MLDIKLIRQNPEKVKEGLKKKGVSPEIVDQILELDKKRREHIKETENLKTEQNKIGKKNIEEARKIKAKIAGIAPSLDKIKQEFNDLVLQIPNLPLDDVPVGKNEKDNIVIKEAGERPKFTFKPKSYLEIAEKLDLIDIKRAAKISGTRFGFLKKEAVLLEFALIDLAFDNLTREGFVPIVPPVMLKPEMVLHQQ